MDHLRQIRKYSDRTPLDDQPGCVASMLGITRAPTTFLVNADGIIANVRVRPMAPGEPGTAIEKTPGSGPLTLGSTPKRAN
jgi:hypothetical protein